MAVSRVDKICNNTGVERGLIMSLYIVLNFKYL